jgi:hypothetical protein
MVRKLIVQFVLFAAYMGVVLFLPAGTLAYPGAWALLALMIAGGIIVTAWLAEHDPKLLRERRSRT